MKPVDSINEAQGNAQSFASVGKEKESIANKRFNQFFHWYYFSNIDVFAPSKFIGYKNTKLSNYEGKGTGTRTQNVLKKWFKKVGRNNRKHAELKGKLEEFASSIGKKISKKTWDGTGGVYLLSEEYAGTDYPDEVSSSGLIEGAVKQVTVNAFERSDQARSKCIELFGAKCCVCDFEFENLYGKELGAGFIHVHHLVDISTIGKAYVVDPKKDLRPVCPNCHAMLHKRKPAMRPKDLRRKLLR